MEARKVVIWVNIPIEFSYFIVFLIYYSEKWCGREDSNFHGSYPTATSTLRVYQFRHDRTV